MEIVTVILLIVFGVVLLLVEFMLIPGITIAGIGGLISFGVSIFLTFRYWGSLAGILVLLSIVVFIPVLLYFFFKGRAMKPIILNSDINSKVVTVNEQEVKIGDEGETIGRLAPLGKAKINGTSVEARSQGSYVEPKTKVRVLKIEGNTVIVEPINE
ncbi:MAG: hypothetical protein PF541_08775 [Prolixibacteraceae bacterium]|jgi:membrane-bound ClpP family serine protease|nr:hypothetical protein [Prolixibacteraceae bacterium]